ncbi:atypical chemokine receptor 4 [Callorhinchus milii]|uniref:Atypical chemokine receptor 4b n=1 Tax=Callorhinchus milii TaxID=7868 RepID=V9KUX5_CALMI|nr:atypical chemokine receptor 4 [Callorhinchus milii]|eukprot:gi/632958500/ref/XP_007895072.1/ PREDICTED: atypical chemokine receptor 4-like [Callorhinchus milii]
MEEADAIYYGDYNESYFDDNSSINYEDYIFLCEKDDVRKFAQSFLPAFYTITLILGLAGNSLVIAIYAYYKRIKTKTDLYIMNVAIADLLLLFTLPFWALQAVHGWVVGIALCKICSVLFVMNFNAGMFFLACISVDRYVAISRVTSRPTIGIKGRITCLCVWLLAFLLSIPDLIFTTVANREDMDRCMIIFRSHTETSAKAMVQVLEILLTFVIPLLVMVYCYSKVARALSRVTNVKKRKTFKVLLAVVGLFFLTQVPYNIVKFCRLIDNIYLVITDCQSSKRFDVAIQVTVSIALFHSCLNPILYVFMGATFKSYIVKAVKEYSYLRRQRNRPDTIQYSFNSLSQSEQTTSFTM